MNFKILGSAVMLSMLVGNVSAMEIFKGKVVSQKLWTNDGSQARLVDSSLPANKGQLQRHDGSDQEKFVFVTINAMQAKVGEKVDLTAKNYVSIANFSDEKKSYALSYRLCSMIENGVSHCLYFHRIVELEAGGYMFDSQAPTLTLKYKNAGQFFTDASSSIYHVNQDGGVIEAYSPVLSDAGTLVDVS